MPKRSSSRSSVTPHKNKRARKHNANVTQNTSLQTKESFKLALLAEVKKYPILYTSLDKDEDLETCYGAWEKIAEALQIDESTSLSPMDCIKIWQSIKRYFVSYIGGNRDRTAVIIAMQCLFPDFNEENLLYLYEDENNAVSNPSKGVYDIPTETRQKANHTAVRKVQLREPSDLFELKFINEVKKYPILCTSLDVDADSETCYGAWEKIAEAIQIDEGVSISPVDYYRKIWNSIKCEFYRYIKYRHKYTSCVMVAMRRLFPENDERFVRSRQRDIARYAYINSERLEYEDSGKKDAENNAAVPEPQDNPAGPKFELALIAEVKKYPIIYKTPDEDIYSKSCFKAWEKIAEALQLKPAYPGKPTHVQYCRGYWSFINDSISSRDSYGINVAVVQAMQSLRPEYNDGAGDNNELNNSPEAGSATAESAEEIIPPTTEDAAVPVPQKADIEKQFDLPEQQSKITSPLNQAGRAYCICRSSDSSRFMIACDVCEEWFHGDCIKISEREVKNIKNYFCEGCREKDPNLKTRYRPQKIQNDEEEPVFLDSTSESGCDSDETYYTSSSSDVSAKKRTAARPTKKQMCEGADKNNEMNSSPEAVSATAESAEEIIPPTTEDAAVPESQQAATPGNPRNIGARLTERAVSLAIIDHLFDSLRSAAATTDVCNLLIQLLYKYQPNVLSDVIEYGSRQPDLFLIDWSGLPIPEDLCRVIWRRDAEEKLRKSYTISSSKRRAKKEN